MQRERKVVTVLFADLEADAQLRLAMPIFAQLGASAWQAEAESLLAASA